MIDSDAMGQHLVRSGQRCVLQLLVADPVCACTQGVTFEQVQIEVDDSFKDVYDEVSQPVACSIRRSIFAAKPATLYRLYLSHWHTRSGLFWALWKWPLHANQKI